MIKFSKKIILFGIPPLAAIIVCVVIYGTSIPNVSNSLSFNAKMLFLKEKKIDTSLNVLAVGSSIALNNIHSTTMAKSLDASYVNTGSWGQSIIDNFKLIKTLVPQYKPKQIIIASNFMDFQSEWAKIKFELIGDYLSNSHTLSEFDLKYNIKNADKLEEFKKNQTLYDYLKYDDYGGINLDANFLKIDSIRWTGRAVDESPLDPVQYAYLDSISNFCKTNKIDLVFVQSPFRAGYYGQLTDIQMAFLNKHIAKIDAILTRDDQQFINTLNGDWPDDLFVDYSHLNKEGAAIFTTQFLAEIHAASK